jgi:hypothetical protein
VKSWQTALAILASLSASLGLAEDFKTINGKEYKNATVTRVEPDGIVLRTKSGIIKVYFIELSKDVQERFHYNVQTPRHSAEANPELDPIRKRQKEAIRERQEEAATTEARKNLAQDAQFDVELKEGFPRGRFLVCNVTFNGRLPPPETVDKIVHDSLQSAALSHPTREILAMAWQGDDTLEENQYSGNLIYKPAERRIMTLDESRGVKTSGLDVGAYYVAVREDKTLAGIKPERKWLSLSIVFPSTPSVQEATDAAIAEIEKRLAQGLDIDANVEVGDKGVKTSWQQMPDPAGGLLAFRYTVADRTIYNKSTFIKKLP